MFGIEASRSAASRPTGSRSTRSSARSSRDRCCRSSPRSWGWSSTTDASRRPASAPTPPTPSRRAARRFGTPALRHVGARPRGGRGRAREPRSRTRGCARSRSRRTTCPAVIARLGAPASTRTSSRAASGPRRRPPGVPNDRITLEGIGKTRARPAGRRPGGGRRRSRSAGSRWRAPRSSTRSSAWPRAPAWAGTAGRRSTCSSGSTRTSRPETHAGLAVGAGGVQVRDDRDRAARAPSRRSPRTARSARAGSTSTSGRSSARSTRGATPSGAASRCSRSSARAGAGFDTLDVGGGFPVGEPGTVPAPARFARGGSRRCSTALPADRRPRGSPSSPAGSSWRAPGWLVASRAPRPGPRRTAEPGRRPRRRHDRAHPARAVRGAPPDRGADLARATGRDDADDRDASRPPASTARSARAPTRSTSTTCRALRRGDLVAIADAGAYAASMAIDLQRPAAAAAGPARARRASRSVARPGAAAARANRYGRPVSLPRDRFAARLAARPLLADGGMGTLLFSRGIPQRACLDELATSRPDLVGTLHREYLDAGAELDRDADVRRQPVPARRLRARRGGRPASTAARPRSPARPATSAAATRGSAARSARSGRRRASCATPTTRRSGRRSGSRSTACSRAASTCSSSRRSSTSATCCSPSTRRGAAGDIPVIASMTFGDDLVLADGTTPEQAVAALTAAGVDAIGVNCGVGPVATLDALARARARPATGEPARSIMPNAGLPQRTRGPLRLRGRARLLRLDRAPDARRGGADHRRLLRHDAGPHRRDARRARGARHRRDATCRGARGRARAGRRHDEVGGRRRGPRSRRPSGNAEAALRRRRRGSAQALADGPVRASRSRSTRRGASGSSARIDAARLLRDAGADVVNISDSAMARVRMGAMAVAFGIQHDLDLECVVHTTTRDRNLMALESELLGAHALGIRNILALTGDPPRVGDYPTGTGVWDVDSIGLIEILTRLNRGEDQAGSAIGQQASFTIACALDPTAARRRHRVGPARAQARRRGAARDDPAAVRRGPGGGDARRGAAAVRPARLPRPDAARRAAARLGPPRGVPPQRGPRDHDPRRGPGADARGGRGAAPRPGSRWPTRCSPPSRPRPAAPTSCRASGATSRPPSSSAGSARVTRRSSRPDRRRATAHRPGARLRIVHACA